MQWDESASQEVDCETGGAPKSCAQLGQVKVSALCPLPLEEK